VLRISGGWETGAEEWSGLASAMLQVWQGLEA
jgi:hypothetical protein